MRLFSRAECITTLAHVQDGQPLPKEKAPTLQPPVKYEELQREALRTPPDLTAKLECFVNTMHFHTASH